MAKTVNVHLTKNWFAPGGVRFRAGDYEDFPQHLLAHLPSTSVVNDGSGPVKAKDWQAKNVKKATKPEDYDTNRIEGEGLADPGAPGSKSDPSNQSPANGESMSPASPKSSGPETQALPSQETKTGEMVTASGTKPADKAEEIAAKDAGKKSKFDI